MVARLPKTAASQAPERPFPASHNAAAGELSFRWVEEAIAEMQPGLPGIAIDTTIFRPATFIEMAVGNLASALLLGVSVLPAAAQAQAPLAAAATTAIAAIVNQAVTESYGVVVLPRLLRARSAGAVPSRSTPTSAVDSKPRWAKGGPRS